MSRYKSFHNMSGGPPSGPQNHHTPIGAVNMQDIPSQQQRKMAGIRNLQRPMVQQREQHGMYQPEPQQMPQFPMQMPQFQEPEPHHMQMPQFQQQPPMYGTPFGVQPPPQPNPWMPTFSNNVCGMVSEHIKNCKDCSKSYKKDSNTYISIIIGLILFIMFLLTKIIDRFG